MPDTPGYCSGHQSPNASHSRSGSSSRTASRRAPESPTSITTVHTGESLGSRGEHRRRSHGRHRRVQVGAPGAPAHQGWARCDRGAHRGCAALRGSADLGGDQPSPGDHERARRRGQGAARRARPGRRPRGRGAGHREHDREDDRGTRRRPAGHHAARDRGAGADRPGDARGDVAASGHPGEHRHPAGPRSAPDRAGRR
ncbi:hypothetical protein HA402_008553 [Bradysia odoriphaga]|nr:hypothetical protein HA402_008553 [Bradysia odoriphaga]